MQLTLASFTPPTRVAGVKSLSVGLRVLKFIHTTTSVVPLGVSNSRFFRVNVALKVSSIGDFASLMHEY